MLKIKLMLIAGALALTVLGGLWFYVSHLKSENEILTANNAQLDDALEREKQSTAALLADSAFKDKQLLLRQDQLTNLATVNAKLKGELRETETQPVQDCLAVVPSDDFINRLRKYSEGQSSNGSDSDVSESVVLPEED